MASTSSATGPKAVGYLELDLSQFKEAIAFAEKALLTLGAAFAAFKTVDFWKNGIEGAIAFGNAAYFAAQKLNGYDPGKLFLVQKALQAGGLSADEARQKISDFALAGRPLEQLFKGGQNGFADALSRSAKEYGTQAAILTTSAEKFAYVQQQLTNLGTKLQGFFLGLADKIAAPLSALFAQIDKIDLVGMGEKFGGYITKAIDTISGLLSKGNLLETLSLGLKVGFETAANYLLGAVNTVIDLLTNSKTWEGLGETFVGVLGIIGSYFAKLFVGIGQLLVATVQAMLVNTGLAKFLGIGQPIKETEEHKEDIINTFGHVRGAQINAEEQKRVDAYNQQHSAFSGDVTENVRALKNNATVQSLNGLTDTLLDSSKQLALKGVENLKGIRPHFERANLYDTGKDTDRLTEMLESARKTGASTIGKTGNVNPLFNETADPYHVIADSLAKVGGGGRYVRTGLSIAEKAQIDLLLVQRQSLEVLKVIEKKNFVGPPAPMKRG